LGGVRCLKNCRCTPPIWYSNLGACLDYARSTTAEIAEMSAAARAIALHATPPAAGQPADNGKHSIEPSSNSTLGARRPADLTTITQMAAQLDAQVEFLLNTHVRAHCLRLRTTASVVGVWSITTPSQFFLRYPYYRHNGRLWEALG